MDSMWRVTLFTYWGRKVLTFVSHLWTVGYATREWGGELDLWRRLHKLFYQYEKGESLFWKAWIWICCDLCTVLAFQEEINRSPDINHTYSCYRCVYYYIKNGVLLCTCQRMIHWEIVILMFKDNVVTGMYVIMPVAKCMRYVKLSIVIDISQTWKKGFFSLYLVHLFKITLDAMYIRLVWHLHSKCTYA